MSKLKELEKRLAVEPDNLGLRVMLAGAMRDAGRQAEAVELYRSVAVTYRDQGRTQQAISVCRSILELAPDDVRCHALLATLVASKGPPSPGEPDTAQRARTASASLPARPSPPPRPQLATPPRGMQAVRPPSEIRAKTSEILEPSEEDIPTLRPRTSIGDAAAIPSIVTPRGGAPVGTTTIAHAGAPRSGATTPPHASDIAPPRTRAAAGSSPPTEEPRRRSSMDETPLPKPLPYHVADPSTRSIERVDLPVAENVPTRPGSETQIQPDLTGIANAARRISASLIAATTKPDDDDVSIEQLPPDPELDEGSVSAPRRLDDVMSDRSPPPGRLPIRALPLPAPRDSNTPPAHERAPAPREGRAPSPVLDSFDDAVTAPPVRPHEDDAATAPPGGDEDEQTRPRDMPGDAARRRTTTPAPKPAGALGSPFFSPLPLENRADVLSRFHRRSLIAGAMVIRQGERNHALVLVASGRLEVRADRSDGRVVPLGAVGPGEYIGEAALLARVAAPAHVIALTDVDLLVLQPRDFYEIAGAYPALWAELKAVAERRTREHDAKLRRG